MPISSGCESLGDAAYREIIKQAAETGLTDLIEQVRAIPPTHTLSWFDAWWASADPSEHQRKGHAASRLGGTSIPSLHLEMDKWLDRFRRVGFVSDSPDQARPTSDLVVYRGATRGSEHGMSWTMSERLDGGALNISRAQAYLTIRSRGFPLIELGPQMLRVRRQDLDRWLSERAPNN